MDVLPALRGRLYPLLGMGVVVGVAAADSGDTSPGTTVGNEVVEACFDRGPAGICPAGEAALPDLQAAWEAREKSEQEESMFGTWCTLLEVTGPATEVAGVCCYPVAADCVTSMGCGCGGRRLTVALGAVRGRFRAGRPRPGRPVDPHLAPAARRWLALWWAQIGAAEHASVVSFARFAADLEDLGAPPPLIARARRAGRDEARHARVAFALAGRYAGVPLTHGALPRLPRSPARSLAAFAAATTRDAAVEEARSTVVLARMAAEATDPAVTRALTGIVADEIEHVALAWETVAWAMRVGGLPARRAVRRALTAPADPVASWPRHPQLAAHGCPGRGAVVAAIGRCDQLLVAPLSAAVGSRRADLGAGRPPYSRAHRVITTSSRGDLPPSTGTAAMASTTSSPAVTTPNTA